MLILLSLAHCHAVKAATVKEESRSRRNTVKQDGEEGRWGRQQGETKAGRSIDLGVSAIFYEGRLTLKYSHAVPSKGSFIGKLFKLVNASTKGALVKYCAAHLG